MGCQPLDRNRKRADASRSVRPRQSLPGKYLPDVIKNITSADTNHNFTKLSGFDSKQSVFFPADLETSLPADGSARRSKHSRHNFRKEEPGSSLLLVLAQVQDFADRQCHRATSRY